MRCASAFDQLSLQAVRELKLLAIAAAALDINFFLNRYNIEEIKNATLRLWKNQLPATCAAIFNSGGCCHLNGTFDRASRTWLVICTESASFQRVFPTGPDYIEMPYLSLERLLYCRDVISIRSFFFSRGVYYTGTCYNPVVPFLRYASFIIDNAGIQPRDICTSSRGTGKQSFCIALPRDWRPLFLMYSAAAPRVYLI